MLARKQFYNHMELNSIDIPNDHRNEFYTSISRKGQLPVDTLILAL